MTQKRKVANGTGPAAISWGKGSATQIGGLRAQGDKAWSTTAREKRPLSLKNLRGLCCDSY